MFDRGRNQTRIVRHSSLQASGGASTPPFSRLPMLVLHGCVSRVLVRLAAPDRSRKTGSTRGGPRAACALRRRVSWRSSRSGRSGLAFAGPHIVAGPGATKDKAQATAADWSARPTVCVFVFTGSGARSTLVIDHGPLASASVVLVIIQSSSAWSVRSAPGFSKNSPFGRLVLNFEASRPCLQGSSVRPRQVVV